jgi:hypothetical protein
MDESSAFTAKLAEITMITFFFLNNRMGAHATLTVPTRGRNVPSSHDRCSDRSTSPREPPKKAHPSSAHSGQQTLSLDSFSKKELRVQNPPWSRSSKVDSP